MKDVIGVCVLLAALTAAGCAAEADKGNGKPAAPAGPSAEKEGVTWTHKELIDHLNAKGVDCRLLSGVPGEDPASLFGREGAVDGGWTVRVELKRDAKSARESAGAVGVEGFAWGRFYFLYQRGPDYALLAAMKAALPGAQ